MTEHEQHENHRPKTARAPEPVQDVHHRPHHPAPHHSQPQHHMVARQATFKENLKTIWPTIQLIVGAILLAVIINQFIFQSYEVFGQSMAPTLSNGDRLVISKVGKTWSRVTGNPYIPDRGDIIVFVSPQNPDIQLIKRVVGLPGDRVILQNGRFTIFNNEHPDGFNPDVEFGVDQSTFGDVDLVVPDDELFVSGDNRDQGGSLDSRNELGTVPVQYIVGTLALRYIPFDQAEFF